MCRQRALPQRRRRELRVRRGREKVSTHRDHHLHATGVHRLDRIDRIEPVSTGRLQAKLRVEPVEPPVGHFLKNPHRAIALHIRVTAYGTHPGTRPPHIAAQQEEIYDGLNRLHRIRLLRQTHGPTTDRRPRFHRDLRRRVDLLPRHAARRHNLVPRRRPQIGHERVVTVGVGTDKRVIKHSAGQRARLLPGEHFLHDAFEQREISADAGLQPEIREPRAVAEERRPRLQRIHEVLRILKPLRPDLGQRIHRHDLRSARLGGFERGQHARVIRAGILADHKNRLGLFEVLQFHGAFADPDGLAERDAARFVAHVGAVRQIVRPQLPHEELPQKRRFVARPARGVKCRRIRRRQRPQFVRDERKRIVPRDRLVVARTRAQHHRRRQPPLRVQPVVALRSELGHRMFFEKFRRDPPRSRLVGHGLGTVFAKLKRLPVAIRARPRAALAVEAVLLVHLEQQFRAAHRAHCTQREACGDDHRLQSSGRSARGAELDVGDFDGRLRSGQGGRDHGGDVGGCRALFNSAPLATIHQSSRPVLTAGSARSHRARTPALVPPSPWWCRRERS